MNQASRRASKWRIRAQAQAHNIQDTSLEAYEILKPNLGKKQRAVYNMLNMATLTGYDMTNTELSKALHWPINCVTPRVYELRHYGLVKISRVRPCAVTKRRAMAWQTVKGKSEK